MGVVYKARDTVLGRVVALKMLKTGSLANDEEVKRFYREAKAVAKLKHPHIVPIYDVGQHNSLHYFTMEYVPGGTLASHLPHLHADITAAVGLVEKVARAVEYAHQNGILHRDLKPANILIDEHGEPRVSDLGLAKLLNTEGEVGLTGMLGGAPTLPDDPKERGPQQPADTLSPATGIAGTPSYMSPEQASGQKATRACDIWGLGVVLYELLTGRQPFLAASPEELFQKLRSVAPVPPRQLRPQIDASLERICLQCLEKDATKRPASAGALACDLQRCLQRDEGSGRFRRQCRRHPIVAATAALMCMGLLAAGIIRLWPDPDRPLRELQRRLAAGEPVVLLAENDVPRWFRWQRGRAAIKDIRDSTRPFALDSSTDCLMELLPHVPGQGYHFQAQVRHEYSAFGEVGIAFALSKRETSANADAYFLTLTFNDQEARIKRSNPSQWCSQVALSLRHGVGPESLKSVPLLTRLYSPPVGQPGPAPWRSIAVSVTPQSIEAFWEGDLIGVVRLPEIARSLERLDGLEPGRAGFPLSDPAFPHSAGVGLFLIGGISSFQQVIVEPAR
jgi:serine/threonine-protein kinase